MSTKHYDVCLISKTADFDCEFKALPASSADEATATALQFVANPEAWLPVSTVQCGDEWPSDDRERVDLYIAKWAHLADLSREAKRLGETFEMGRTEGTHKDVRVYMTTAGYKSYRSKASRRVTIVDKLKPRKPKKERQDG